MTTTDEAVERAIAEMDAEAKPNITKKGPTLPVKPRRSKARRDKARKSRQRRNK